MLMRDLFAVANFLVISLVYVIVNRLALFVAERCILTPRSTNRTGNVAIYTTET